MFAKKPVPEVRQVYIASPSGGFMTRAPTQQANTGFSVCGICRCCTCVDFSLGFITTPTGLVKSVQFILGLVCQFLILQYGGEWVLWWLFSLLHISIFFRHAEKLGIGYSIFLTVNSASVLTTFVLLICYVTSTPTYTRIRPSLFVRQFLIQLQFIKVDFSGGDLPWSVLWTLYNSINISCNNSFYKTLFLLSHFRRLLCLPCPDRCLCK